eukprot:1536479-Pleurochrysis_carterae.AAC.4
MGARHQLFLCRVARLHQPAHSQRSDGGRPRWLGRRKTRRQGQLRGKRQLDVHRPLGRAARLLACSPNLGLQAQAQRLAQARLCVQGCAQVHGVDPAAYVVARTRFPRHH